MNESKFKEIYHQYKSSGLPKEEFCKVYEYTKSSFNCWLQKQLKEVLSQLAENAIRPITVSRIDVLNKLPYILNKKESLDSLMPDRCIEQHPESLLCTDLSKVDQT